MKSKNQDATIYSLMKPIDENFTPYEFDEDLHNPRKGKFRSFELQESQNPEDLVLIMPSLSIPNINLRQDYNIFKKIILDLEAHIEDLDDEFGSIQAAEMRKQITLNLVSGYPSFPNLWFERLFSQNINMKVIGASPFANSFFNAGYIKSKIPLIYRNRLNAVKSIFDSCTETALTKEVYEWEKLGWTFHAKSFGLQLNDSGWFMNTIGSSNFSRRSFNRDVECNLLFFSNSHDFARQIDLQREHINKNLIKLDSERAKQRFMRYGPIDYLFDFSFGSFS